MTVSVCGVVSYEELPTTAGAITKQAKMYPGTVVISSSAEVSAVAGADRMLTATRTIRPAPVNRLLAQ